MAALLVPGGQGQWSSRSRPMLDLFEAKRTVSYGFGTRSRSILKDLILTIAPNESNRLCTVQLMIHSSQVSLPRVARTENNKKRIKNVWFYFWLQKVQSVRTVLERTIASRLIIYYNWLVDWSGWFQQLVIYIVCAIGVRVKVLYVCIRYTLMQRLLQLLLTVICDQSEQKLSSSAAWNCCQLFWGPWFLSVTVLEIIFFALVKPDTVRYELQLCHSCCFLSLSLSWMHSQSVIIGRRFSVANFAKFRGRISAEFLKFCGAVLPKYPTFCSQLALLY